MWSLTLGEERGLRVFVNRVLRRIFGPEMDEVTMEWRRLHNEELCDLEVRHPRCVGSITKNFVYYT